MTTATLLDLFGTENPLSAKIASQDALDVRAFTVREGLSKLFEVHLLVRCENPDVDLEEVLGRPASFRIDPGTPATPAPTWSGLCPHMAQTGVEDLADGVSTYELTIVPLLWLLTERRNHRVFQRKSEPQIVLDLLAEWYIEPIVRFDLAKYRAREYRVQYAESDFDFLSRMLEDAGITYFFEAVGGESKLVLTDAPQAAPRRGAPLVYANSATGKPGESFATDVRPGRRTRPGRYVQRDWDFRVAPTAPLFSEATAGLPQESELERFHYVPNALHFFQGPGPLYPVGDDKGKFRRDVSEGDVQAERRVLAKQGDARSFTFVTNALDVQGGTVLEITDHPRPDVAGQPLLIVDVERSGESTGEWTVACSARSASAPYHPPLSTDKPRVMGIEPATVVGPKGQEIHVDEFGRVRVHFHWDRESKLDENSSVWIPVSQFWAGPGYGHVDHPRVGHEVLIDFLGGDPDQPIVIGRLYTAPNPVIYPLVANKTKSGWRSESSPGGGGYNELMFEDKKGEELVRFQAEKDYTALTKRDSGTVVRRDSLSHVGRDQTHAVLRDQTIRVKCHRRLRVESTQSHWVDKDIYQESLERSTVVRSRRTLIHHSNQMDLFSVAPRKTGPVKPTELPIKSFISISPDKIVIQAPLVDINPGAAQCARPPKPDPVSRAEQRNWYFFGGPEEDGNARPAREPTTPEAHPDVEVMTPKKRAPKSGGCTGGCP